MTGNAPDWRAIRDRVRQIARHAERLAGELPDPLTEAFHLNLSEITAEAEAAERLIFEIDPEDDSAFDAEASLAEVWQIAGGAALAQVEDLTPAMAAALESLVTHRPHATLH